MVVRVDDVVLALLVAEQLEGAVRDDLVRVHVRRGAGTALDHQDGADAQVLMQLDRRDEAIALLQALMSNGARDTKAAAFVLLPNWPGRPWLAWKTTAKASLTLKPIANEPMFMPRNAARAHSALPNWDVFVGPDRPY